MSTNILMPALSPTMEEGKLAKWHVKEGDTVKSGDILAEIETDKSTMEFEAVDEGKIGKLLVPEGAEHIKVNAPIAMLLEEGETAPKAQKPSPPAGEGARPSPKGEDGRVRGSTEPSQNPAQPLPPSPPASPPTSGPPPQGGGEE